MFQMLGRFPPQFVIAVSGGVDSMVLTNYVMRFPKFRIKLAYFNHGTDHGKQAQEFVSDLAAGLGFDLCIGSLAVGKPKGSSWEEHWRTQRYSFLDSLGLPVATAHTLDDAVETWIFSSLHGQSKLLPYTRGPIFRPFLCVSKHQVLDWADRNAVRFIQDTSNADDRYMRNLIRAHIVPQALRVNPGLPTVIRKKILDRGV